MVGTNKGYAMNSLLPEGEGSEPLRKKQKLQVETEPFLPPAEVLSWILLLACEYSFQKVLPFRLVNTYFRAVVDGDVIPYVKAHAVPLIESYICYGNVICESWQTSRLHRVFPKLKIFGCGPSNRVPCRKKVYVEDLGGETGVVAAKLVNYRKVTFNNVCRLKHLSLVCCQRVNTFDCLRNLQNVVISSCHDLRDVSVFSNVKRMMIESCQNVRDVSSLGGLNCLTLSRLQGVTDVSALGGLKKLMIVRCYAVHDVSALGGLEELVIVGSYRLTGMDKLCTVKYLSLISVERPIVKQLLKVDGVQHLRLENCCHLQTIPCFQKTKSLILRHCYNVNSIDSFGTEPSKAYGWSHFRREKTVTLGLKSLCLDKRYQIGDILQNAYALSSLHTVCIHRFQLPCGHPALKNIKTLIVAETSGLNAVWASLFSHVHRTNRRYHMNKDGWVEWDTKGFFLPPALECPKCNAHENVLIITLQNKWITKCK